MIKELLSVSGETCVFIITTTLDMTNNAGVSVQTESVTVVKRIEVELEEAEQNGVKADQC